MESREYKQEEYMAKFGYPHCPACGNRAVKTNNRTKGSIEYIVYICDNCKRVIGRKIC